MPWKSDGRFRQRRGEACIRCSQNQWAFPFLFCHTRPYQRGTVPATSEKSKRFPGAMTLHKPPEIKPSVLWNDEYIYLGAPLPSHQSPLLHQRFGITQSYERSTVSSHSLFHVFLAKSVPLPTGLDSFCFAATIEMKSWWKIHISLNKKLMGCDHMLVLQKMKKRRSGP